MKRAKTSLLTGARKLTKPVVERCPECNGPAWWSGYRHKDACSRKRGQATRFACPHCLGVHAPDAVCVVRASVACDAEVVERVRLLELPHYVALATALEAYLAEFGPDGYDSSDFPAFVSAQIRRARGL